MRAHLYTYPEHMIKAYRTGYRAIKYSTESKRPVRHARYGEEKFLDEGELDGQTLSHM